MQEFRAKSLSLKVTTNNEVLDIEIHPYITDKSDKTDNLIRSFRMDAAQAVLLSHFKHPIWDHFPSYTLTQCIKGICRNWFVKKLYIH
jgi:hypothetical protein